MKHLLLYLIMFISLVGRAQTFTGRVVDASGTPLVATSVVAKDTGGSVVAFARANADGQFTLTIPRGKQAQEIEFNMMGFGKKIVSKKDFKNGQTIRLSEKTVALREVKVRPQKIRSNGDTLTYSVSAFRQGQDRSIADVIAKMPGLEVKPNGTIQYQGKAINKFYIEGMDLLGGKYAQASENLSPDKIKSVQVYENHQPVKALKDIQFSEQAALNLVLKDDAKNVWQGIVDVGTGATLQGDTEWLRDVRILEMVFGRKRQSISMYKTNNTGKDIEHEVADLSRFDKTAPTESGILHNISLGAPSLDAKRSKFNDTHIVATNWLFKTKKDDDLKLQLTGLYDRSRQQQERQTLYLDADSAVITEAQTARSTRSEWQAELLYKANRENHYLSNTLKGYIDFNKSEGLSMLNGTPTPQRVEPRKRYIVDNLELINKLSGGRSYSITSLFSYSYLPSSLLLSNDSCLALNQSLLYWDVYGYYQHTIKDVKFTYKAGFQTKTQTLEAGLKDKYSEYRPYFNPSLSYRAGSWSISLLMPFSWLNRKYQELSASKLLFTPHLYIKYDFTSKFNVSGNYGYRWSPNDIADMSRLPIYTDYITQRQGSGQLEHTTGHNASLGLNYRNVATGFFGSLNGSYSHSGDAVIYRSRLVGNVYTREATDYRQNSDNYSLYANLGQSFFWMKLSISLSGRYSWNSYDLLIGDAISRQNMRSGNATLRFSMKPTRWLSIEEESAYRYSHRSRTDALQSMEHQLKLFLLLGKWQIEWANELYHSNDESVSTNYFSDLSVSYRTKTYEIGLQCHNLFGTHEYRRHYTTSYTDVIVQNQLRPREFLFKVFFNI